MPKKIWIVILIAILLISGGGAGIYFYRQAHDQERLLLCAKQMEAQGKYLDALNYYQAVEKIIKSKSTEQNTLALLYLKSGNIYFLLNQYDKAIKHYEYAEKIWALNKSAEIIQVYSNLATIYLERDHFARARNYYLKAVKETENRGISQQVGLNNFALMYYYLADSCIELNLFTDAETYYLNALAITKNTTKLSALKENIYCHLAFLNFYRNKYINARNYGFSLVKINDFPLSQIHHQTEGKK